MKIPVRLVPPWNLTAKGRTNWTWTPPGGVHVYPSCVCRYCVFERALRERANYPLAPFWAIRRRQAANAPRGLQ